MSSLDPKLPPELEKEIFEVAAYHLPATIPAMMLTAWRVKVWVEPILFRVVLLVDPSNNINDHHGLNQRNTYPLPDDSNLSRISSTPPTVLRDSVHHLYLDRVSHDVAELVLSSCQNVHDLWLYLWDYSSVLDFVGSLPLRRLYCCLEDLFQSEDVDFTHPIFAQLTHLELFPAAIPTQAVCNGLALIPNLTHLAVTDQDFLEFIPDLLQSCKSLRVVILLAENPLDLPELEEHQIHERLVLMPCKYYTKDWHMSALVGWDYWARAEEFIARRRSGVVERTQFVIPEDGTMSLRMPGEL
ncbi:hypothetical protein FB45DRAFT_926852 [Roridomyces roridus]|uniref:Uncharacterized protein n=1 Tax=Roridomyces roridus TaxID=1738132 RepID=A0AAD7BIA1_9AGAR|nr:hypothetical protein FB45DRAFT_926852 [Roridomyces roridus]